MAKNATETGTSCACTGAGVGTVVDLGGRAPVVGSTWGVAAYTVLHVLSCQAGGLKAFLQANSSSGYSASNLGTDVAAFTSRACRDSQWVSLPWNCASATSTDRRFYRAAWTQTCGQENKWLLALDVKPREP